MAGRDQTRRDLTSQQELEVTYSFYVSKVTTSSVAACTNLLQLCQRMDDPFAADLPLSLFFKWCRENLDVEELLDVLLLLSTLNRDNRTRVREFLHADNCLQAREVLSELLIEDAAFHVLRMEQILSSAVWLREEDERAPRRLNLFCSLGRYRFEVGLSVSNDSEFRGRRVELFVASGDVTLFRVAFNDQVQEAQNTGRLIIMGPPSRNLGSVRNVDFVDHRALTRGTGPTYTRGDTLLFDRETNEYHEGPGVYERALMEIRELVALFSQDFHLLVPQMLNFSSDITFGYLRVVYVSSSPDGFYPDIKNWASFLRSLSRTA